MVANCTLKPRDNYLNRLILFKDTELVKVVTGIRRCGKSSLLALMIRHLKETGVPEEQIIHINFETNNYRRMTDDDFDTYIRQRVQPGRRMYLFFDEIQHIKGWEGVVNAFRVDLDSDIYITGSNAYMLSSEYATYLSGRYIEIKMLPLSFAEFLDFHGFRRTKVRNLLGGTRYAIRDTDGTQYDRGDVFALYLHWGGMPGLANIGLSQETVYPILDGIYSTVVMRDILQRGEWSKASAITNYDILTKIILFLADNIGNVVSMTAIANTLRSSGKLQPEQKKPSVHTVQEYVDALCQAYFVYETKRVDVKGREYLRTQGKFYLADIGLRNFLLGYKDMDRGHVLENVVFLELRKRGYDVAVGKVGSYEVDFIAIKDAERHYIQVTESMLEPTVRERELRPLKAIADNYPKTILCLDAGLPLSDNGIIIANIIDWLLEDKPTNPY